jgi:hypothetical protein
VGQAQLIDDLSITRGRHTIKVGENFRRNRVSDFGLLTGTTGYLCIRFARRFCQRRDRSELRQLYQQKFTQITTAT